MTKVILHGCNGKMGKVLSALIEPMEDMTVVAGIDVNPLPAEFPVFTHLSDCALEADVLIDFSHPKTLPIFLPEAVRRGLPAVIATTGLSRDDLNLVTKAAKKIPVFRSANMSLGINLVQQLIKSAAKVLGDRFDIEIVEKHHRLKKDAPSGTALMLADSINEVRLEKLDYIPGRDGAESLRKKGELGLHSFRGGTIVGEHDVYFAGTDEMIQVGHKAYSRQVFATGALAAAKFLSVQKPGLYNMQDMINQTNAITTLYTFPDEVLITLEGFPGNMQAISGLYGDFASADIFIDMISHSGWSNDKLSLSFTINSRDLTATRDILQKTREQYPGIKVDIEENITKLTVEGPGMEFQSGVASRVFSCMAGAGINILAVTTSEIKISCIISDADVNKAAQLIRKEFEI